MVIILIFLPIHIKSYLQTFHGLLQQMQEKITSYYSSLIFFNLEINSLSQIKFNNHLKNNKIKKYKYWMSNIRKFRKHMLNKDLEKLLDTVGGKNE